MTHANNDAGATFKQTEIEDWEHAASAWHRWIPAVNDFLSVATDIMLDQADIKTGYHVLDIAAGDGSQSIMAAERVGKTGSVLATDISPAFVKLARNVVQKQGIENITAEVMDAENLALKDNSFDAAISRLGMMFLPDPLRGLQEIHRVLKPSGSFAAVVFTTADKSPFFTIPPQVIRDQLNLHTPSDMSPGQKTHQPGPFALGTPDVFADLFSQAGFVNIEQEVIEAPLRFKTTEDFVQWRRDIAVSLQRMLTGLDRETQERIWQDVTEAMRQFETSDGFETPSEFLICSGQKPGNS
ncbi:class I SAM-dependent methyltransferase [Kiloniella sp. EL199]|uniref:class I SAM-dependent methyltransferase n=1 Tax=Kiloniella sp. EL199 TaxID=2107581 RepID=UPI000EA17A80|nr:class I SAM-dependent methyltransferase [Kiloniella sp. EL199]